jgi:acyl carrier protein
MNIVEELKEMIIEELLDEEAQIEADTSLFKGQILDSLKLTMLIAFIEDEYEIRVKPLDIVYENFDTITTMKAYIEKQLG